MSSFKTWADVAPQIVPDLTGLDNSEVARLFQQKRWLILDKNLGPRYFHSLKSLNPDEQRALEQEFGKSLILEYLELRLASKEYSLLLEYLQEVLRRGLVHAGLDAILNFEEQIADGDFRLLDSAMAIAHQAIQEPACLRPSVRTSLIKLWGIYVDKSPRIAKELHDLFENNLGVRAVAETTRSIQHLQSCGDCGIGFRKWFRRLPACDGVAFQDCAEFRGLCNEHSTTYCRSCARENVVRCWGCHNEFLAPTEKTVREYCPACLPKYARCKHPDCRKYILKDRLLKGYCELCHGELFPVCNHCKEVFSKSELTQGYCPKDFKKLFQACSSCTKLTGVQNLYSGRCEACQRLLACPSCGKKNRMPTNVLKKKLLCGHCKSSLVPDAPIPKTSPNKPAAKKKVPAKGSIRKKTSRKKKVKSTPVDHHTYTCPTHSVKLVIRKGRYGYFYGCPTYGKTRCKYTQKSS